MDETDRAIEEAKRLIKVKTLEVMKKIAIRVMQTIILATPVDTGRARGNWLVSLGSLSKEVRKDAKDTTGGATIGENTSKISSSVKAEDDIHISNNLDYIIPLNEGHSAQAPAGYVEKALQVARIGV